MPEIEVDPSALLRRCAAEGLGVRIPAPVNRRLNVLCAELEDAGAGLVEKHELVSALLVDALRRHNVLDLVGAVQAFRTTKAHQVMPEVGARAGKVKLPALQRGRPVRRRA